MKRLCSFCRTPKDHMLVRNGRTLCFDCIDEASAIKVRQETEASKRGRRSIFSGVYPTTQSLQAELDAGRTLDEIARAHSRHPSSLTRYVQSQGWELQMVTERRLGVAA